MIPFGTIPLENGIQNQSCSLRTLDTDFRRCGLLIFVGMVY